MWRKKGREVERRISRGEGEKSDLIESLPRIIRSMKLKPTTQISCEPKLDRAQARLSPRIQLWGRTIGAQLAPSVGISCKAVVWRGLEWKERCLKNILEGMPNANPQGPLGGPLGGSEGKKDMRTKSANWRRGNLALGKDYIKHSEQYWVPLSMTNMMKETKKLSSYVGW